MVLADDRGMFRKIFGGPEDVKAALFGGSEEIEDDDGTEDDEED